MARRWRTVREVAALSIACCLGVVACSGSSSDPRVPLADTFSAIVTNSTAAVAATTPAPSVAPTETTMLSTSTAPLSTAAPEPGASVWVELDSVPSGVIGELVAADESVSIIVTPWAGDLPVGSATIEFQSPKHNTKRVELNVVSGLSETVYLDKQNQLVTTMLSFTVGGAPKQVAFTPDNAEIWVTLLDGDGVEVYEPFTGELLAEIDLAGSGAVEVIFNAAGTLAYVSQMETSSVYEIDVASKKVLRNMPAIGAWTKVMVLSPDERTLYASNWVDDNISEFDLETGQVVRILPTVKTPRGLYVTPDGEELWVAGFLNGEIQVIDLAKGRGTVIYRSGGSMRHLVGDDERGLVYASDMTRANTLVIDVDTREVAELAKVDRTANTIDLSPDGQVLYVSSRGRNHEESYHRLGPDWGSVAIIDTATGRHFDTIVGGNQPTGLDVSPDGQFLAHSDFLDNRVTIYEIPSYEVYLDGNGGRYDAHFSEIRKRRSGR
ncbi:MAG: YncE family protein, partial [Actinomycetota bacterium]|jgi:DNA-binding beta-propeller fold protein YncE|nr:YncE family protein [Actinomycetota bacterium]